MRIDHGLEWILSLYIQETLAHLRTNTSRAPHLQSSSKQVRHNNYEYIILIIHDSCHHARCIKNHKAERFWVEINSRVNYPIKRTLIWMQEQMNIDLDCPCHRFCISWFTIHVASAGVSLTVQAWNNHPIPGQSSVSLVTVDFHFFSVYISC